MGALGKSWKTTLIGIGIGGGGLGIEALKLMQDGGSINWHNFLISFGMVALGVMAKDADKSGPTRPM